MLRFRNIISKDTMLKLYKAFILPHFYFFIFLLDKGYVCMYKKSKSE